MFRAFELSLPESVNWRISGTDVYAENESAAKKALDSFLTVKGTLDGSEIQSHWFPDIDANVFISFSHTDLTLVKGLAQWLAKEMKLKPFVDSTVWGYSNHLLRQIDEEFCYDSEKGTFRYEDRNFSTGHVHMMLAVALSKMIDATECVIFLNTPNSISSRESINRTASPWIFFEMAMFNLIKCRSKEAHREMTKVAKHFSDLLEAKRTLSMEYIIETAPLAKMNIDSLNAWKNQATAYPKTHPLDILYDMIPE